MKQPSRPIAADWLELRRTADGAARDRARGLWDALTETWAGLASVTVIDVGAGTGANQDYLTPRLGVPSRWVLLDHDEALLAATSADAIRVLGGMEQLDQIVQQYRPHLVTCSALLDLLSQDELDRLAGVLARHRVPGLFSLTVDGTVEVSPPHADDAAIRRAFNAHQRRADRPGPEAASYLASRCEQLGLTVTVAETPWVLDAADAAMVTRLLTERVDAAVEEEPALAEPGESWLAARASDLAAGHLDVRVGHTDLLVEPARAG